MTRTFLLALGMAFIGIGGLGMAQQANPRAAAGYIKVEAKGTLRTGIVAIGGETTGTLIDTGDGSLELDFAKNTELRAVALKYNGKSVVITGTLRMRRGIEMKMRTIVTVATFKPAE